MNSSDASSKVPMSEIRSIIQRASLYSLEDIFPIEGLSDSCYTSIDKVSVYSHFDCRTESRVVEIVIPYYKDFSTKDLNGFMSVHSVRSGSITVKMNLGC